MATGVTTSKDVFKNSIAQPVKKRHEKVVTIRNKLDQIKQDHRKLLVELDDIGSMLVSLEELIAG